MPIGFSTGALAKGDFRTALRMLEGSGAEAVELSALREGELDGLLRSLPQLQLDGFAHVSLHAPSAMDRRRVSAHARNLRDVLLPRGIPCVLHPDALRHPTLWKGLGDLALIENMDARKPSGRTADELREVFRKLPDARLCFDVAHAWHVDPTMDEAERILDAHGHRLAQIHASGIHRSARHERLDREMLAAAARLAPRLPDHVPVILESPVTAEQLREEIGLAREALRSRERRSWELGVRS